MTRRLRGDSVGPLVSVVTAIVAPIRRPVSRETGEQGAAPENHSLRANSAHVQRWPRLNGAARGWRPARQSTRQV
jgi:hypothetical protein